MKPSYQVVDCRDSRQLSEFLAREGQFLLPMLDLITQAEMAVDELIDAAGRATIEAVLTLSAQKVAGGKHKGRKTDGEIGWHGRQGPLRRARSGKPYAGSESADANRTLPSCRFHSMHDSPAQRLPRRLPRHPAWPPKNCPSQRRLPSRSFSPSSAMQSLFWTIGERCRAWCNRRRSPVSAASTAISCSSTISCM